MYPPQSRVARGNLVLRHAVPHFPPNSRGIACCVAELHAALCLDTRAKKRKYTLEINMTFPLVGIEPPTSHFYTVCPCATTGLIIYKTYKCVFFLF